RHRRPRLWLLLHYRSFPSGNPCRLQANDGKWWSRKWFGLSGKVPPLRLEHPDRCRRCPPRNLAIHECQCSQVPMRRSPCFLESWQPWAGSPGDCCRNLKDQNLCRLSQLNRSTKPLATPHCRGCSTCSIGNRTEDNDERPYDEPAQDLGPVGGRSRV